MGEATPAARPRLVDWLVTPFFLIAFAGSLIAFDPLLRIARLFGLRAAERVGGVLQWWLVRMVFPVAGTRMVVERHPGVRADASYLVISNHQSMFDIPIFGALLFGNRPKYVSKRELASGLPSISYYLRCGGHALIDRDDRAGAVTAIRALAEHVRADGVSAVIFPEGTRARRGALGSFKPAGALALLRSAPEIPVVVVAIDESWRLLRWNLLPIPFGTRVRVAIGAPVERKLGDDPQALLEGAHAWIEHTIARWRGDHSATRS